VVLLTPVVVVTVRASRARPRPPLYATVHLANSASLPLPVSNLTNLPATLLLLPIVAVGGTAGVGPAPAMLIGVNIGPNLAYPGLLATLLWRRVVADVPGVPSLRDFTVVVWRRCRWRSSCPQWRCGCR
jgi:Na+/H+ antiporter NhaD/arsenite permease-like protein